MAYTILNDLINFLIAGAFVWLPLLLLVRLQAWAVRYIPLPLLYPFAIIGVPVHELAHAVVALVCGHKVSKIELFKPDASGTLGYVEHSYTPGVISWFTNLLIGLAPLFVGVFLIWLLSAALMPSFTSIHNSQVTTSIAESVEYVITNLKNLFVTVDWDTPGWIWLYLVTSISMFMIPSKPDFQGAAKGILAVLTVSFGCYLLFPDLFYFTLNFTQQASLVVLPLVVLACLVMFLFVCVGYVLRLNASRKG